MPIDPNAPLRITAFDWVPDFARGYVRDLRARWACEEIGLPYATRLISAVDRPEEYYAEQPWGQVPVIEDDGLSIFESGAILLHLGERDERLLPRARVPRARVISWLFAAYNSVEPLLMELGNIDLFAADELWAKLRRPSLLEALGQRLDRLAAALGARLAGRHVQYRRHCDGHHAARGTRQWSARQPPAPGRLRRARHVAPRVPGGTGRPAERLQGRAGHGLMARSVPAGWQAIGISASCRRGARSARRHGGVCVRPRRRTGSVTITADRARHAAHGVPRRDRPGSAHPAS